MQKLILSLIFMLVLTTGLFQFGCSASSDPVKNGLDSLNIFGSKPGQTSANLSKNKAESMNLSGSKQGQSVAFADVDGDGTDDKLVGAPYAKLANGTGVVLVYKGSASEFSANATSLLTGDDNAGFTIINLGDVDRDGVSDFAVSAINGNGENVSLCGSVTIYKGAGNGSTIKKLSGEGPMDKFGYAVASGDVNGDGRPDIAVGAPFNTNDPARYQGGAAYVFLGPDFATRVALYASSASGGIGSAIALGDVNNDGSADLLLSGSAKVLVYFGGSSFAPSIDKPNITITSSAAGFGKSLALIGDLTGDGAREIAIGAPNSVINNNRDTGSVYLITGSATGKVDLAVSPPPEALIARIDGEGLFSRFGASIVALGDIDEDGKPDFAVGAPLADVVTATSQNVLSGKVYVFKGKDVSVSLSIANATKFEGKVENQHYGTSLALSRSGKLLIGAPRSNGDTGGADMVDPATGLTVPGGASGGITGGGEAACCY